MKGIHSFLSTIFNQFEVVEGSTLNILISTLVVFLVFFSGLFIGRVINKQKENKKFLLEEDSEKKTQKDNPAISEINYLKDINKNLIMENTELRKEISQLRDYKSGQNTLSVESNSLGSLDQENKLSKSEFKSHDQTSMYQTNSVFFQYPEEDGSFKKNHGTTMKSTDSYFEIVYKENQQEGELRFVADRSSYGKILTLRDSSLRPVSEIEYANNDRPSNITTIKNGVVEIKEDRFIIKEGHKLKINIS